MKVSIMAQRLLLQFQSYMNRTPWQVWRRPPGPQTARLATALARLAAHEAPRELKEDK